jgi:hypothetical protein
MNLFKRATTRAALGALAAGTLALAAPAAAQATTITGAGTSVTFSGTGSDYITQDQAWSYDPSNSTIDATASADGNHVSVGINGDTWWYLDFAAPQGQALTAGTTYDNATRYPFQDPTGPGLSLYGDGRGCNTLTGSFTVNKAVFGPNGWIQSFDATFVQHCEGSTTSEATGEIDIENGPAPAKLSVTVTPAATASVDKSGGQATITGTVTCNENATVGLWGALNETLTRSTLATGNWSVSGIACSTTPTTWTATVQPIGNVPFANGEAQVSGTYSSTDPVYQVATSGTFSQDVKLRNN